MREEVKETSEAIRTIGEEGRGKEEVRGKEKDTELGESEGRMEKETDTMGEMKRSDE